MHLSAIPTCLIFKKKIELIFRQIFFYKPANSQSKKHINTELRKKYTSFLNSNEDINKKYWEFYLFEHF